MGEKAIKQTAQKFKIKKKIKNLLFGWCCFFFDWGKPQLFSGSVKLCLENAKPPQIFSIFIFFANFLFLILKYKLFFACSLKAFCFWKLQYEPEISANALNIQKKRKRNCYMKIQTDDAIQKHSKNSYSFVAETLFQNLHSYLHLFKWKKLKKNLKFATEASIYTLILKNIMKYLQLPLLKKSPAWNRENPNGNQSLPKKLK